MRSFLDELGLQLSTLAGESAPPARRFSARRPSPSTARRPARRVGGGALLAAAGAVCALSLTTGTPATLQVLAAPTANASELIDEPGLPPSGTLDLGSSRPFPTPDGTGYVIPSRDGIDLCLVLPDGDAPGSFGSGCAPVDKVERHGLPGEMARAGVARRGTLSRIAFVLPAGAGPEVRIVGRHRQIPVEVHHGVAVATLHTAATLEYRVGDTLHRRAFEGPLGPPTSSQVVCGERMVNVPLPRHTRRDVTRLDATRFCRRSGTREHHGQRSDRRAPGGRSSESPSGA